MEHTDLHIVPRYDGDKLPQFWDGQVNGCYNTVGKPEHPEHVKPTYSRKPNISMRGGKGDEQEN
jgi:diadenosine tetraphosphate (Ap4A) HIT family hydrolase